MLEKSVENHSFDFNVGYLVKSPCKECANHKVFPACMEECEILEKIQSQLSDSMSSANNFSVAETFDVPMHVLEQI